MKLLSMCLGGAAALALATSAHAATILKDGKFSNPTFTGSYSNYTAGNTIGDWTVASGDVDLIGAYWTNPAGSKSIDLDGYNPGSISQTLQNLVATKTYTVKFLLAGNPDGGAKVKDLNVSVGASGPTLFTFDTTGHTDSNLGWKSETLKFTATSSSELLTFASGDGAGSAWGPAIADISVEVPEPATWAMMLMGFGGLGAAMRMNRRRQGVAVA